MLASILIALIAAMAGGLYAYYDIDLKATDASLRIKHLLKQFLEVVLLVVVWAAFAGTVLIQFLSDGQDDALIKIQQFTSRAFPSRPSDRAKADLTVEPKTGYQDCVSKGVAYFQLIGAYPKLLTGSNAGRKAEDVAAEVCRISPSTFSNTKP